MVSSPTLAALHRHFRGYDNISPRQVGIIQHLISNNGMVFINSQIRAGKHGITVVILRLIHQSARLPGRRLLSIKKPTRFRRSLVIHNNFSIAGLVPAMLHIKYLPYHLSMVG